MSDQECHGRGPAAGRGGGGGAGVGAPPPRAGGGGAPPAAGGARIRTDVVDGFRCDRGFQVLNPAYPALPGSVDVAALRLQPFLPGVGVRRERGSITLVHPLRKPAGVPAMLTAGALRPADVLALGRWTAPALRPSRLRSALGDTRLADALDSSGVQGEVRRVLERFLSGVLLDASGATSNAFALLLVRMFVLGVPALPADGMAALPRLLAAAVPGRVRTGTRVTSVERGGRDWTVRAHDGATMRARQVVIATDPGTAAGFTGEPAPAMRGVITDWWASDVTPATGGALQVDGRAGARGPVVNTAVISDAAPSYAPPGRQLIQASALHRADDTPPSEEQMRAHAAEILGVSAADWQPVVRHVVSAALPAQPAPLVLRRSIRVHSGLWVCGDHRDTASIQGALVSGRRTGAAVLRALSCT